MGGSHGGVLLITWGGIILFFNYAKVRSAADFTVIGAILGYDVMFGKYVVCDDFIRF